MLIGVYSVHLLGVSIHIGVGVIVYSYVQGITRTSSGRISKDKVPRLVLFTGMVGTANPSKFKHYGTICHYPRLGKLGQNHYYVVCVSVPVERG